MFASLASCDLVSSALAAATAGTVRTSSWTYGSSGCRVFTVAALTSVLGTMVTHAVVSHFRRLVLSRVAPAVPSGPASAAASRRCGSPSLAAAVSAGWVLAAALGAALQVGSDVKLTPSRIHCSNPPSALDNVTALVMLGCTLVVACNYGRMALQLRGHFGARAAQARRPRPTRAAPPPPPSPTQQAGRSRSVSVTPVTPVPAARQTRSPTPTATTFATAQQQQRINALLLLAVVLQWATWVPVTVIFALPHLTAGADVCAMLLVCMHALASPCIYALHPQLRRLLLAGPLACDALLLSGATGTTERR